MENNASSINVDAKLSVVSASSSALDGSTRSKSPAAVFRTGMSSFTSSPLMPDLAPPCARALAGKSAAEPVPWPMPPVIEYSSATAGGG